MLRFIADHLPEDERRNWLTNHQQNVRLRFDPYDWGLNVHTSSNEVKTNIKNSAQSKNQMREKTAHDAVQ